MTAACSGGADRMHSALWIGTLLGAAPALADAGSAHHGDAACQCAQMKGRPEAGERRSVPNAAAAPTDREAEFLTEVWSAP